MLFHPAIDDQLTIDGVVYQVCAHPAQPGQPFIQAGDNSQVIQLRTAGSFVALKVQAQLQTPTLRTHASQLQELSAIPGLQTARRKVVNADEHAELITRLPALNYALLMPWIHGPTWQELIRHRRPLNPPQCLELARALANLLVELEKRSLVHGDLHSAHLMLPGLVDPGAVAPVALVDLETLHGIGVIHLPIPVSSSPYQHPIAAPGLASDRFGGALLLVELLGWCDERVRAAAANDSFFSRDDLLRPGERFEILRAALAEHWGLALAQMLDRLWQSASPTVCPTLKEWMAVLPSPAAAPTEPATPPTPLPILSDPSIQLLAEAAALRAQGQPAQAISVYRNVLEHLPARDPRASEVMNAITAIEKEMMSPGPPPGQSGAVSWKMLAGIGITLVVLLGLLAMINLNRPSTAATPTIAPTPASTTGAAPPTQTIPLPVSPTPAPSPLPTSPTAARVVTVNRINPTELLMSGNTREFTVQGQGLAAVRTAILRAAGYDPIPLEILAGSSDSELRLRIARFPANLEGVVPFTLELDGTPVAGAAVTLRDFLTIRIVTGARSEYRYTGRIEEDQQGALTWMYAEPSLTSTRVATLRNGDEVEILAEQPDGWYYLRIRTSADPQLVGNRGFIERWLVDNTNVPPPPTPTTPPEPPRLRFVKLNENADQRCIVVEIRGIKTTGWRVTVDGLRLEAIFNANNVAQVCGLRARQEVTITVRDENSAPVRGGVGVPARGSDVLVADWR